MENAKLGIKGAILGLAYFLIYYFRGKKTLQRRRLIFGKFLTMVELEKKPIITLCVDFIIFGIIHQKIVPSI